MTARRIGLILGPLLLALTAMLPPPTAMPAGAWLVAGLVMWMAAWWMTEAVPLSVTALLRERETKFQEIIRKGRTGTVTVSPTSQAGEKAEPPKSEVK